MPNIHLSWRDNITYSYLHSEQRKVEVKDLEHLHQTQKNQTNPKNLHSEQSMLEGGCIRAAFLEISHLTF